MENIIPHMTTSIFIKTYKKDLKWLRYSLQSIEKYASGFSEIVIVADEDCKDSLASNCTTHYVPIHHNGYVQQQAIKLVADTYCTSDYILFVDSDCVFFRPFNPNTFIREGKPILLKTQYGNLGGGEVWKSITESVVGWTVDFEYMRRLPLMYHRDTLKKFRDRFPNLLSKLNVMQTRDFSEFNAVGAFIDKEDPEGYDIVDTKDWIPEAVARQFWSWGGISPEIKEEIERILEC